MCLFQFLSNGSIKRITTYVKVKIYKKKNTFLNKEIYV